MELDWLAVVRAGAVVFLALLISIVTVSRTEPSGRSGVGEDSPEEQEQVRIRVYLTVFVLLFLGACVMFAELPYIEFLAESLIVVALIGLVLEVRHIREFFQQGLRNALTPKIDITGTWDYVVRREGDDTITHTGWCTINQMGDDVLISGRRMQRLSEDGSTLEDIGGGEYLGKQTLGL